MAAYMVQRLGLTEDELVFYDVLETDDSAVQVLGDEALLSAVRDLIDTVWPNVTIDWTLRENVRARLHVLVRPIPHKHGYSPNKRGRATPKILEQAGALSVGWALALVLGGNTATARNYNV